MHYASSDSGTRNSAGGVVASSKAFKLAAFPKSGVSGTVTLFIQ